MNGIWRNDPRTILGRGTLINQKSTPYSDIALPKFVTDPLYTSSQAGLDKLGTGLITGEGIPDYYKSIGDFNSPQFQAMLNSVKGQVMQSSQEASAINGTGRSGVGVTASNNALNSILPQLTYQDYTRALAGRGALLDEGVNVESGVRGSAQTQGLNESNFNQTLFLDQMARAGAIDSWKKDAAGSIGSAIGTGVGALGGFLIGGPAGAMAGAGIGGSIGGGFDGGNANSSSSLSQLFSSLGKINTSSGTSGASYGVSDPSLGSFKSLSSLNSSNPAVSALLYGG